MNGRRISLTGAAIAITALTAASPAAAQRPPVSPPSPPTGPCGGLLQPPCPPPREPDPPPQQPPQQPATPTVTGTLQASKSEVSVPERIVLTATFPGAPAGTAVLLERAFPGYAPQRPDDARLGAGGVVRWNLRPRLNATYRVVVATGQSVTGASNAVDVHAYPRYRVKLGSGQRRFRAQLTVDLGVWAGPTVEGHPKPASGDARYAFFYANPRGSKRFFRVARARLGSGVCALTCARVGAATIRVTRRVARSKYIFACTEGLAWRGGGLPFESCGRRVVR